MKDDSTTDACQHDRGGEHGGKPLPTVATPGLRALGNSVAPWWTYLSLNCRAPLPIASRSVGRLPVRHPCVPPERRER
jgi:hypothetical protein